MLMSQTFLNSSLTVSASILFQNCILPYRLTSGFFMFFLSFVTRCMPSTKRASNCSRLMRSLSANAFPNSLRMKPLPFNSPRPSVYPGTRACCGIPPRPLIMVCRLRPQSHPKAHLSRKPVPSSSYGYRPASGGIMQAALCR